MSELYTSRQSEGIATSIRFDGLTRWLILIVVACGLLLALYGMTPPQSVGIGAPPSAFSSARAMENVGLFASRPRPIGSAAHGEVRAALLSQLTALGLDPQVQQAEVANRLRNNLIYAATVANVMARLKGTEGKEALMLAAHYDSVPTGPGASDNAAGVAALLETARALKAGPPLQNDVIFLFTDSEETGLLGAKAFVNEHPWAKDVKVALNFEARGNGGPSIMFETSPGNQELISGFAKVGSNAIASSLTYDIYKLLPNDTDLTVFKNAKFAGLNFAYIDGITQYHTSLDTPDRVNERSLQHHGDQALALARYFGDRSLTIRQTADAIYFDLLGTVLFHYPAGLAIPLAGLGALLFALTVYLGFRKGGRLKLKAVLRGIGIVFASFVVAPLLISFLWWLTAQLQGARGGTLQEMNYHSLWYLLGFIALTLAINMALFRWLGQKIEMRNLAVAAAFWWTIATLLSSLFLPGGSYLFLWPLLFNLVALNVLLRLDDGAEDGLKSFAAKVLAALPLVMLWPPIIYLIFTAVGFEAIAVVALMATLAAVLLILPLRFVVTPNGWRLPGVTALAGLALIIIGLSMTGSDSTHPKSDHLFYAMNATTGKAIWASGDERPDAWTSQYFPDGGQREALTGYLPWRRDEFLSHEAPSMTLPAPELLLSSEEQREGSRVLKLRAKSLRNAPLMSIVLDPDAIVEAAAINGKQVAMTKTLSREVGRQYWRLNYYGLPADGIDLTLQVKTTGPVKIFVTDQSYGLPEIPGADYKPRPKTLMPSAWLPFSDQSLVNKSFTF
ncbi:MAG: M20/M25/M40 family metallo-hydrolase [Acidobacteriota bacterium]